MVFRKRILENIEPGQEYNSDKEKTPTNKMKNNIVLLYDINRKETYELLTKTK